jgi:hypothetical protein
MMSNPLKVWNIIIINFIIDQIDVDFRNDGIWKE